MAVPDISAEIAAFKNAAYGEDVRDALIQLATKLRGVITSELETMASTWNTYKSGVDSSITTMQNTWTSYKNSVDQDLSDFESAWDTYKDSVDSSLEDFETTIDLKMEFKGKISDNADLNNIKDKGIYYITKSGTSTIANVPYDISASYLIVGPIYNADGSVTARSYQQITDIITGKSCIRYLTGSGWNAWSPINDYNSHISNPHDFNLLDTIRLLNISTNNHLKSGSWIEIPIENVFIPFAYFKSSDSPNIKLNPSINKCAIVCGDSYNSYITYDTTKYKAALLCINLLTGELINSDSWQSQSPYYTVFDKCHSNQPCIFVFNVSKIDDSEITKNDIDDFKSNSHFYCQVFSNHIYDNSVFIDQPYTIFKNIRLSSANNWTVVNTRATLVLFNTRRGSTISVDTTKYRHTYYYVDTYEFATLLDDSNGWVSSSTYVLDSDAFNTHESISVLLVIDKKDGTQLTLDDISDIYDSVSYRLAPISTNGSSISNIIYYDLWIFMGQSNMAGRGISNNDHPETAPTILNNAGYEFRAISDPTKLYTIAEPFGVNENNSNGINDGDKKTGSLVTAFVNAYYQTSGVPIIAVSASKGGSSLAEWQPDITNSYIDDAMNRLNLAKTYCINNNINIRHVYAMWCQGEHEAVYQPDATYYETYFNIIANECFDNGVEKIFITRVGNHNNDGSPRAGDSTIIQCQTNMCKNYKNYIMATTVLASYLSRGLMKDTAHYYQEAYNEAGTYAGINCGIYANTGKEPTMYDPQYDNLYFTKCN